MLRLVTILLALLLALPASAQVGWNGVNGSGRIGGSPAIGSFAVANGSTGNWTNQQASVNALLGFSGVTTGDMAVYNGSNWVRFPSGNGAYYATAAGASPTIGALPIAQGGTAGTTQQTAVNGVLGFPSVAKGDIAVYNGSNWVRFGVGADGTVLSASSGAGSGLAWISAGVGSVTSFSAGNLSPLFTTSVATATSTPALTFALSTAAAHTAYMNNTGSTAAPGFQTIGAADIPATVAYNNAANSWSAAQAPNAAGTIDIGTTALPFRNVIIGGAATNNSKVVSGTTTAQRTVTVSPSDADSITVVPVTSTAHQFLTNIPTTGVQAKAQPDMTDLTGTTTIAQGGSNNSGLSVAQGTVYYGDGSKLVGLAPGTSGNFLQTAGAGANPVWAAQANAGIGGLGGDGAKSFTGSETTAMQYNATTITASGAYNPVSGSVYNCNAAFTTGAFAWTVGNSVLGSTNAGTNGGGPSQATGANAKVNCGGGGGGGAGQGGGGGGSAAGAGQPGRATSIGHGYTGSAGGVGDAGGNAAGAGGGVIIVANSGGGITISTSGSITAVGGAGASINTASTGAPGGGSGGMIELASTVSTTMTGSVSVAGGVGGTNSGATSSGGGGGGGGYVLRHSPSNTGAGTITVSGGTTGTGTSFTGGASSSGVSIAITGTPSLPLIAQERHDMGTPGNWGPLALMAMAQRDIRTSDCNQTVALQQRESVTYLASLHATPDTFNQTCYALNYGTALDGTPSSVALVGIGDAEVILNAA